MEIYWDLRNLEQSKKAVITIGTFDGVHIGHQALLRRVIEKAKNIDGKSTLVTFSPHPKLVVHHQGAEPVKLLSTIEEKIDLLQRIGLDRLIILNFTDEFSKISSTDFIENVLIKRIGFQEIVVGHDHAFGKDRAGSIELLRHFASRYQYRVELVDAVCLDGEIVSSTLLRNLIAGGAIEKANQLLARPYSFSGRVVRGEGRGRALNFPTANIQPLSQNKLIPKDGVYAVRVNRGNLSYLGALSIGIRPTFQKTGKTIEVYLINYNGDLYDETLVIDLLKRLRDEKKFDSVERLVQQMEMDVAQIVSEFEIQRIDSDKTFLYREPRGDIKLQ